MALILGLIGEKLAGKDVTAEFLVKKYGAVHFKHSHILDEILNALGLEISRRNEIDLGMALRNTFGESTVCNVLKTKVQNSKANLVIINGIRFQNELDNARSLGAKIIYITAPEDIRFNRFLMRREKTDDATMDISGFKIQEQEPTEINIPALGSQADYTIENNGDLKSLYEKVDNIVNTLQ